MADQPQQQNINIKITDEVLKGVYSNMMIASHTKEEFILDFLNVAGPQGIAVSKVIVSPGHLKRISAALVDNLKKYEATSLKLQQRAFNSYLKFKKLAVE